VSWRSGPRAQRHYRVCGLSKGRPRISRCCVRRHLHDPFENRDGSFTLKLDILPQTKFQLREEKPVAKEAAAK